MKDIFKYENSKLFDDRTEGVRFRFKIINQLIGSLEAERGELKNRLSVIDSYLPELKKWISESEACAVCGGHGELREIISEDESRMDLLP